LRALAFLEGIDCSMEGSGGLLLVSVLPPTHKLRLIA